MAVNLLYFAWVREAVGLDGESVAPPPEVETIAELVRWLGGRGGGYAAAFADPARVRAAVDNAFAGADTAIAGAREIALFPPVTGG